jgi:hypothetical protein
MLFASLSRHIGPASQRRATLMEFQDTRVRRSATISRAQNKYRKNRKSTPTKRATIADTWGAAQPLRPYVSRGTAFSKRRCNNVRELMLHAVAQRATTPRPCSLAIFGLLSAVSGHGCAHPSTSVNVYVEGMSGVSVHALDVEIKVDYSASETVQHWPGPMGEALLPGKFTVVLPDVTKSVTLTLRGYDMSGNSVTATNTTAVVPFTAVNVTLVLGPGPSDGGASPPTDGGTTTDGDTTPTDSGTSADLGCGAPCSTGKPGACAMGTVVCSAGAPPSCVSNVMPAAVDNCFTNTDDDCNGTIGNGCPVGIVTGTQRALAVRGGTGGSPFTAVCPANTFVTKTTVWTSSNGIIGVALSCTTPTLVKGASSYSVTLKTMTPDPYVNGAQTGGAAVGADDCGTSGFAAGSYISGTCDYGGAGVDGVDSFGMSCASGSTNFSSTTNQLSFTFTKQPKSTVFVGFNGGTAFEDDCMPNEVLVGYYGRTGNWMDAIQAVCAPLVTVYK